MRVLTENEVRDLAGRIESGGEFALPQGALLTPLARDYLRSRNISVQHEPGASRLEKTGKKSDQDDLVAALADEVVRVLRPENTASIVEKAGVHAEGSPQPAAGQARAVVWAIGGDRPGILAAVAELLGRRKVNILEISQTILSGVFAMVMIVDLAANAETFAELKAELEKLGADLGVTLSAQRDEIFQYMHRV